MLAQSAVQEFGGRARFVSENYGDSKLAKRFGVTRYPAIFVDDVLVATPNDFGFYGKGAREEGGRYAPLKSAAAHERFRSDLSRMITLLLAGRKDDARAVAAPAKSAGVAEYPAVAITDLSGKTLTRADLAGRVVLVELWATWCPPCRSTLGWLGELQKTHGDRLAVVALAVESEESAVRKLAGELESAAPLGDGHSRDRPGFRRRQRGPDASALRPATAAPRERSTARRRLFTPRPRRRSPRSSGSLVRPRPPRPTP